jgi:hypothetical protein
MGLSEGALLGASRGWDRESRERDGETNINVFVPFPSKGL